MTQCAQALRNFTQFHLVRGKHDQIDVVLHGEGHNSSDPFSNDDFVLNVDVLGGKEVGKELQFRLGCGFQFVLEICDFLAVAVLDRFNHVNQRD